MAKGKQSQKVSSADPKSLELKLDKATQDGWPVWSVRLDGTAAHLEEVERVVYVLPSTYASPVRAKTDRASGFRMKESGPGHFRLYAKAIRRDGREVPLELAVDVGDQEPERESRGLKAASESITGLEAFPAAASPRPPRPAERRRREPAHRRLRVYAFDPSLATRMEMAVINQVTLQVPWEPDLAPGPVGEYLEVVDYDPASGCYYAPVDLNNPTVLAEDGWAPSEGTPQFHQQMVYAVAMTAIRNFERALGRRALWSPHFVEDERGAWKGEYVPRLRIYPHALRQANAYYSPLKKALLFGYFPADASDPAGHLPGGMVFTCLSHDVVVHETTHALLDGLHRRFIEATNPDSLAFHEAFADICALFQHFSFPEVLKHQLGKTQGDLTRQNLLGELAQQFGAATGLRGALRSAIGEVDKNGQWRPLKPVAGEYLKVREPHARGAILVAAVFDAFLSIYKSRVADLLRIATGGSGKLPEGQLHPDLVNRLASEASKSARHVLTMCIRALDYCPPFDLTFGEYLRGLITADSELVPDDNRGYRVAVIEAFRQRGIYPTDVRALSEESLRWNAPTPEEMDRLRAVLPGPEVFREFASQWDLSSDREAVFNALQRFQARFHQHLRDRIWKVPGTAATMGLDPSIDSGKFEVHSMRPARRTGPDGEQITELIVEITQRQPVFFRDGRAVAETIWVPGRGKDANFWFRGGCTLLIDPETGDVRYAISKRITDGSRLRRQAEYVSKAGGSLRATYFGVPRRLEESEAFAMIHSGQLEGDADE
ncbi:MAG: pYEATS domain-containing protein [Isosphaeraceae bacterium]